MKKWSIQLVVIVAFMACSKSQPPGGAPVDTSDGGGQPGGDAGGDAGAGGGGDAGGTDGAVLDGGLTWGARKTISQSAGSYVETEPHIATDGDGGLVAAWIGGRSAVPTTVIGYTISRDDGATWSAPQVLESPGARKAADPVVAADSQGRFFVAWLGNRTGGLDAHIYAAALAAGATAFGAPVIVSDDGTSTTLVLDKPWVIVDGSDRVLVTWKDDTANALKLGVSANAGTSYTASTVASTFYGSLPYPCVDRAAPAGAPLYIVFFHDGSSTVRLCTSPDTGATWPGTPCAAELAQDVEWQDPGCVVRGQDLWVVYAAGTSGTKSTATTTAATSVKVLHSSNGGTSFAAASVMPAGPPGATYLLPQIAALSNGALDILYYEGQSGQPITLAHALSRNAGASFERGEVADAGSFAVTRNSLLFLGDYIGLASSGNKFFAAYSNNASGSNHISFVSAKFE